MSRNNQRGRLLGARRPTRRLVHGVWLRIRIQWLEAMGRQIWAALEVGLISESVLG